MSDLVGSTAAEIVTEVVQPPASLVTADTSPDNLEASPLPVGKNSDDGSALWLRRGDRLFVTLLCAVLLIGLGFKWGQLTRWGIAPVKLSSPKPDEYYYSLDINTASWVEWSQLEGIGEKTARRIVADREERGPFRNAADVSRVPGIRPVILEKIKPFLQGGTDLSESPSNP